MRVAWSLGRRVLGHMGLRVRVKLARSLAAGGAPSAMLRLLLRLLLLLLLLWGLLRVRVVYLFVGHYLEEALKGLRGLRVRVCACVRGNVCLRLSVCLSARYGNAKRSLCPS